MYMSKNAVSKSGDQKGIILGIFIGVSEYEDVNYPPLPSCNRDLDAMCLVMEKIKHFDKVIKLGNEKSTQIKSALTSLIGEFKGKNIEEVFFYFSGHGERVDSEFYYVLADFDSKKINSTGLSESYLDGLIREVSPRVYTKMSDACFSGTKYIKDSLENREKIIKTKIDGLGLDNVYYFFSSRENQESFADKKGLSFFTDQVISSIISSEREIKYIDLSGEISDAFTSAQYQQQPMFLMQGSYLDSIGKVNNSQISEIMKLLGIDDSRPAENENKNINNEKNPQKIILNKLTLALNKVIEKSKSDCIDEVKINEILSGLNENLLTDLNEKTKDAYSVSISYEQCYSTPNKEKIGLWLVKNKDLFAITQYSTKTVTTQRYEKPDKIFVSTPSSKNIHWLDDTGVINTSASFFSHRKWDKEDEPKKEELVLKDVKGKESYISGFGYKCDEKKNILKITLEPKYQLLPKIECWFVFIYSHEKFYIHKLFITYIKKSWDFYEECSNNNWSVSKIIDIKKMTQESLVRVISNHIEEYITEESNKILQQ